MNNTFSEAIKLKEGKLYNLPYHQARLDRTQVRFGGEKIILSDILSDIPDNAKTGFFKCRVEYGRYLNKIEFIPYSYRKIKEVCLVTDNSIDYSFKYTDRKKLNKLLDQSGCDDIIIVKQELITDAHSSNLVFRSSEGLFTPSSCLLKGTKRQQLIDQNIITERRITVNDINSYSHVYFINAMIDIDDSICIETAKINIY